MRNAEGYMSRLDATIAGAYEAGVHRYRQPAKLMCEVAARVQHHDCGNRLPRPPGRASRMARLRSHFYARRLDCV